MTNSEKIEYSIRDRVYEKLEDRFTQESCKKSFDIIDACIEETKKEATTDLKKEISGIIKKRIEELKDVQRAEPINDNIARDDWQDIQKIVDELEQIKKAIEGIK